MTAIRAVQIQDQGANWRVSYEWSNDQQTDPWIPFEANFPSGFNDLSPDDVEQAMTELAMAVARGQGVHD